MSRPTWWTADDAQADRAALERCDFCGDPADKGDAICRACSWSESVMRYVELGGMDE